MTISIDHLPQNAVLDAAIAAEGGVSKLAAVLEEAPNVISNWRARGVPRAWEKLLRMKYGHVLRRPTPTQEAA